MELNLFSEELCSRQFTRFRETPTAEMSYKEYKEKIGEMTEDAQTYLANFGAHRPGISREEVVDHYTKWAKTYDEDLGNSGRYHGPKIAADAMAEEFPVGRDSVKILDIGAGTGNFGKEAYKHGFRELHGIDPSAGMLERCQEKNIYKKLLCDFFERDKPDLENDEYDCTVVAGTMGEGHLSCDCLYEMIRVVKPVRYKLQVEQKGLTEKYEEGRTLRGQIDGLVQKLIEEETKLKWLSNKEKILEEQRHELAKEKESVQQQLHSEEKKAMREMMSICNDLSEFIANYGLISNGSHFRDELARKHLDELKKQEDTLSNVVQKYITWKTHADVLSEEKLALTEKLHTLKDEINEGLSELEREREATRTAEKQRDTVADIQSDKQFASLQLELTEAKSKRLEERCNELQEKMQQLQQQMWKRQVSSWQSQVTGHQNLQHHHTCEIDSSKEGTGSDRKRPLEKASEQGLMMNRKKVANFAIIARAYNNNSETEIVEDTLLRNIFRDSSDEDDDKFDNSL